MARNLWSRVPWKPLAGLFIVALALWVFGGFGSCAAIPAEPGTGGTAGSGGVGGDGGTAVGAIDPDPVTKEVGVGCSNSITQTFPAFLWELTVDPSPIESNGKFSAKFEGRAFFDRAFLEIAQLLIAGGVTEVNLLDFQATVSAHAGATGPDVVLTKPDLPYRCTLATSPGVRPSCDPANDLPGGPGLVGNTDCQPEGPSNPCAQFVDIPTSNDCEPEGLCWNVGRGDPGGSLCPEDDFCQDDTKAACAANGFCVTDDLPFPLAPAVGEFVADTDGEVRFGWYEPDRGSSWSEPPSVFEEPVGANGLRLYVGSAAVALECVLGSDGGPLPDNALISFEIPKSACMDDTPVCPPGFASTNDGLCRLHAESEIFVAADPIVRDEPSLSSCEEPAIFFLGQSELPPEADLDSRSLMIRTVTKVTNVEDALCAPSTEVVANTDYWDAQNQRVRNNLIVFNIPNAVSFDVADPAIRKATVSLWDPPTVAWSSSPNVCCERTFQVTWDASVAECEGW